MRRFLRIVGRLDDITSLESQNPRRYWWSLVTPFVIVLLLKIVLWYHWIGRISILKKKLCNNPCILRNFKLWRAYHVSKCIQCHNLIRLPLSETFCGQAQKTNVLFRFSNSHEEVSYSGSDSVATSELCGTNVGTSESEYLIPKRHWQAVANGVLKAFAFLTKTDCNLKPADQFSKPGIWLVLAWYSSKCYY